LEGDVVGVEEEEECVTGAGGVGVGAPCDGEVVGVPFEEEVGAREGGAEAVEFSDEKVTALGGLEVGVEFVEGSLAFYADRVFMAHEEVISGGQAC
jgi:hypothetical protein